jgi:serine/threonine protein kinase/tetratricopeptide (TPR) repeat protein
MSEETIFVTALEKTDPAERAAYLEGACAGDPELCRRVEALLRAHEQSGDLLDPSAHDPAPTTEHAITGPDGGPPPARPIAEGPGSRVGPYRLARKVGEGGMGAVFLAEQERPVRRTVALKVIRPGMDSALVVARLEAERQALAMMDHPNIARFLDAGTTDSGRPYFVMEPVDGVPITEYCDRNRLTPKERLELFVLVCQAIQHAHQKGIIHRDVKPSNVLVTLVDSRPVPKVIDFGIAKAIDQRLTERTLFTHFGALVGTFEYMSPEQAEMNALGVDTRSDIYSLGVLLYELLTGTTPLERARLRGAALSELLRLIKEEEAPRPSARLSSSQDLPLIAAARSTEPARLSGLVRGEIDWIVMKCLEKDRTRRYDGAGGLARDIQRYLADEPVEAGPPTAGYRLRTLARKYRTPMRVAGAFVLLLVLGVVVSIQQALRARAAERQAIGARDDAAEQLRQAKRSEARAQAVLKFFQDKVLSAARPKGQEGGLSRDATVREALDRAEPEIAAAFAGEPLVEASIRNTLGVSYQYLGDHEKALAQHRRAIALRRQELGPEHPETVGGMNDLAIILLQSGRSAEAQKILEEAVAVKRRTLGPEDKGTLHAMTNLTIALAMQGLLEDAAKLVEEYLEIQQRVEGPESIFTLRSTYNLAIMRRQLGRWAEARPLFDESLRTLRRVFGPDHQDTLRAVDGLGELLLDQRRPAEARALFEEALKGQRQVLGPTNEETILTMIDLADAARLQGHLDEARKLAEEADALNRRTLGPEHPQTLFGLTILSSVARDQGHLDKAREGYEQALAALRRTFSARMPEVQRCMADYAWMLAASTDPGHRDPRRAIELANELIRNTPKVRDVWTTLGVAHYRAGAWNDAKAALEKSEAAFPGCFTAVNGFVLAMACWQLGEKERGREWYAKALEAMEQAGQPSWPGPAPFRSEASRLLGISGPMGP